LFYQIFALLFEKFLVTLALSSVGFLLLADSTIKLTAGLGLSKKHQVVAGHRHMDHLLALYRH